MGQKMKVVSVRLPEDLDDSLLHRSLVLGISKSVLIRKALEAHLWGTPLKILPQDREETDPAEGREDSAASSAVASGDKARPTGRRRTVSQPPSPDDYRGEVVDELPPPSPEENFTLKKGGRIWPYSKNRNNDSNPPVEPTSEIEKADSHGQDGHKAIKGGNKGGKSAREILNETELGRALVKVLEERFGPTVAERVAASIYKRWEDDGKIEEVSRRFGEGEDLSDLIYEGQVQ